MKIKILGILLLGGLAFIGTKAEAASVVPPYGGTVCSFTRDLGPGTWGEDVRCLQQYLSAAMQGGYYGYQGYIIADGYYGPLTTQAVIQWQTMKGLPPTGYFDAASRAKYTQLTGGYGGGFPTNSEEQRARQRIDEALRMMKQAEDEIDDSNRNTDSAEDSLEDAEKDMLDAVYEFFVTRDFSEAFDLATDAFENAEDAFDEAGGNRRGGDKEDARDAIEDAEDAIDDAEDEIADARRRGVSITLINRAEDLLDDARDRLDDADDEYDDKDYDRAEDFAKDAEDLAEDAIDKVN